MSEQNNINDEGDDLRRWRIELPNLVDDLGLSVYAFRLYVHIKRRTGAKGGMCTASTRALAKTCKMSVGKVSDSKRELIDAGLISVEKVDGPHGPEDNITIIDIWPRNFEHFSEQAEAKTKRSQGERKRSSRERTSSPRERKRSPGEPKKEPVEEGTKEEGNPPADAGVPPEQAQGDLPAGKPEEKRPAQPHIAVIEAYIQATGAALPSTFKMGSFARLGKQFIECGESASTMQEAGLLVRAWMGSFPAKPVLTWDVGETTDMIRRALALCRQGIGPADIQAFIKEKREEQFWRGKLISFAHVAENIGIWREDLELLKQKGQKGNGTNGQQRYGFGELANATDDEIRAIRAKYGGKSYSDAAAEVPEVRRPGLGDG